MTTIPTLNQLYTSVLTNLETQFGTTISPVGKTFLRAMAATQAAVLKVLYLFMGKTQKNIFVDTADPEATGGTLERFGRVKLGRNPFPAVAGQYVLTITGSIGAVIPAGTTFKSDDSSLNPGMLFVLDNEYILVATTDTITVRSLTAGTTAKLDVLDTLTATAPIALVDKGATVYSITVDALDAETTEAYRTAVINSYRFEPQGGAATDYRLWAADAQGVQAVYPYAKSGESATINLYIEATTGDSTDGKGTPPGSMLTAVEEVVEQDPDDTLPLNERGRRPLGAFQIYYLPITPKEVDVVINGLQNRTTETDLLLVTAITNAINLIRPFVAAADVLANKNDIIDKNKITAVIISQLPGAIFDSISLSIDTLDLSTYTFIDGNIPHVNSITFA